VIRTTVIFDTDDDAVPGGNQLEVVSVDVLGPIEASDDAPSSSSHRCGFSALRRRPSGVLVPS
jgi:hypothetical protein